jgi:hypothetical protein
MAPDDELRDSILAKAQEYAKERGWRWLTPVEVTLTRAAANDRQWTVRTNAFAVGMNARIVIREQDLSVVDAGYLPR